MRQGENRIAERHQKSILSLTRSSACLIWCRPSETTDDWVFNDGPEEAESDEVTDFESDSESVDGRPWWQKELTIGESLHEVSSDLGEEPLGPCSGAALAGQMLVSVREAMRASAIVEC